MNTNMVFETAKGVLSEDPKHGVRYIGHLCMSILATYSCPEQYDVPECQEREGSDAEVLQLWRRHTV